LEGSIKNPCKIKKEPFQEPSWKVPDRTLARTHIGFFNEPFQEPSKNPERVLCKEPLKGFYIEP
jgi:hypothetical protein